MKRFFTLIILATLIIRADAQVLFSQDFESGSLAPMTAVDVDGRTVHPNVAGSAGPTWSVRGNATNRLIVSTSWFNPIGQADDWIISPAIEITQLNALLLWEAFSPDAAFRDGYEVRISTTDNQIASFTTIALTVAAEQTTATRRSLNLDAYMGQTIYFAFRNNSVDKFLLYMDNISVEVFQNNNAIVKSISFEKYNPINTQVPIKVTVENHGAQPLTSLVYTWISGDNTYVDSISGLNIATLTTQEITHSVNFTLTETGEFPVDIYITDPNGVVDEDPSDNSGSRLVYGLDQQLPKKVVVEEGTGTWCGFCPRGFVIMEQIGEDYEGIALPIAIHNFDPMTVPEYDTPFSQTIGGYPSGHVDRKEINIDPKSPSTGYGFDDAIENLDDRMVPVQLDVQTVYNDATRTVQIKGVGNSSIATQQNAFRYMCVIVEDGVTGPSPSYDQVNYYANNALGAMGGFESLPDPVPASQLVYNFVARGLLGGFFGMENSIPDNLNADEYFEVDFSYQVPASFDVTKMKAIVIILDEETGEMLNADDAPLTGTLSTPLIPTGKSALYPNPANEFVNLTVDFQTEELVNMKVYTTYGTLVRDLGILNLTDGKGFEKIDVSELNAGMYILELRHKNSVTALPFTKL